MECEVMCLWTAGPHDAHKVLCSCATTAGQLRDRILRNFIDTRYLTKMPAVSIHIKCAPRHHVEVNSVAAPIVCFREWKGSRHFSCWHHHTHEHA